MEENNNKTKTKQNKTKQNKILRLHDSSQIPISIVHLSITHICVTKNVIRHKVTFDPSSSKSIQSKKKFNALSNSGSLSGGTATRVFSCRACQTTMFLGS